VIYGSAPAGRYAQQTLQAWVLSYFNENGWTTKQSEVDQSISFVRNPAGSLAIVITYVDDVDTYGPDEATRSVKHPRACLRSVATSLPDLTQHQCGWVLLLQIEYCFFDFFKCN
jgi:hypothetical protein